MSDKPRDLNDILREDGPDAARAFMDDAKPYTKGNGGGAEAASSRFAPIWLDDIKTDDEAVYIVDGILPSGPSFGETAGPFEVIAESKLMPCRAPVVTTMGVSPFLPQVRPA
jgi:hypothetical protein